MSSLHLFLEMYSHSLHHYLILLTYAILSKVRTSMQKNSTTVQTVECSAYGIFKSASITCRFPAEVYLKDVKFVITAIDTNVSRREIIATCFPSGANIKCIRNGVYFYPNIKNNSAEITIAGYCKDSYIFTCIPPVPVKPNPCVLEETDRCSKEEVPTDGRIFGWQTNDSSSTTIIPAKPENADDKKRNDWVLASVMSAMVFTLCLLTTNFIWCLLRRRRRKRSKKKDIMRNDKLSSVLLEAKSGGLEIIPTTNTANRRKHERVLEEKELMSESCIKPFTQWASEKEGFLFDCKHSLADVSELQLDRYLHTCKELECECKIYINDQILMGDGLPETDKVVELLQVLNTKVACVIMQLELQQQKCILNRLKFSTQSMILTNQDLLEVVNSFIVQAEADFHQFTVDTGNNANINELHSRLTRLMEIELTCSYYEEHLIKTLQSQRTKPHPKTDYEEVKLKLLQLHDSVMLWQVFFKNLYSKELDQTVLRSITEKKTSNTKPDKANTLEEQRTEDLSTVILLQPREAITLREGLQCQRSSAYQVTPETAADEAF